MIIHLNSEYRATGRSDAVKKAEELWQAFMEDPLAKLPWACTIDIEPSRDEDPLPYKVKLFVKETKAENGVLKSGG
jgi:hypothetical protein